MRDTFKIIIFWLKANYNQLFIIFFLIFFCANLIRLIVQTLFNL